MRLSKQLRSEPTFNRYQQLTSETAVYPEKTSFKGLLYVTLKLAGEAGEVAEKLGKILRDRPDLAWTDPKQWPGDIRLAFKKELGDCEWYIANAAAELGFTHQDVAETNLEKLQSRRERGTLSGSGDDR